MPCKPLRSILDSALSWFGARRVDFASIDTEGSEFEILEAFDFKRYPFKVITCEHNFTPAREKIHGLLTAAGYVRKYEKVSDFQDFIWSNSTKNCDDRRRSQIVQ